MPYSLMKKTIIILIALFLAITNTYSFENGEELQKAAWEGNLVAVKSILSSGINPDTTLEKGGFTALIFASARGNYDICQELIAKRANVNYSSADGKTPIIALAEGESDNIQIARLLLNNGAKINAKAIDGATAFTAAFMRSLGGNHTALLEFFIKNGANINEKLVSSDNVGLAPLHLAANSGNTELLNFLLDNGAEVDIKNVSDETPLILAVKASNTSTAQILIKKGADKNTKDKSGNSAYTIALDNGSAAIQELFDINTNK